MPTLTSTIDGNSHIKKVLTSTISGNAKISFGQDIFANAKIVVKKFVDVISRMTYTKFAGLDKRAELDSILQPTPVAPISLTATDLATGDSIRLDWPSSGSPGYNVYKSTGGPFTKVNNIVLGSGETTYIVGGLTTGVAVTFHVKGVNGEGTESAASPTDVETPTLDLTQSKFTSPTWSVKINAVTDPEIVLEEVKLGYGSDLSRATFFKVEDSASLSEGDDVEVIVNSRTVFKGIISTKTDVFSGSGIRFNYSAASSIVSLTKSIVKRNRLDGTVFNRPEDGIEILPSYESAGVSATSVPSLGGDTIQTLNVSTKTTTTTPSGLTAEVYAPKGLGVGSPKTSTSAPASGVRVEKPKLFNDINGTPRVPTRITDPNITSSLISPIVATPVRKSVSEILQFILGYVPTDTPSLTPGQTVLTDIDLLTSAETVLKRLGNFRLYYNIDTDQVEVYQIGSGGKSQRLLEKGKHILESNIVESTQDIVDEVTVVSSPVHVYAVTPVVTDFNHSLAVISPDGSRRIAVTLEGRNIGNIAAEGFQNSPPSMDYNGQIQVLPEDAGYGNGYWPYDATTNSPERDAGFRSAVRSIRYMLADWRPLASTIEYWGRDKDKATVYFGEFPKIWFVDTRVARFITLNLGGAALEFPIRVFIRFFLRVGPARVRYEFDADPLVVRVGSGSVKRTITENSFRPYTGIQGNNIDEVISAMATRADGEYRRLNHSQKTGSITILGDETVDLRTTVNGLDVTSVTHRFTSGFTTTVQLTNEPSILEFIPENLPSVVTELPENAVVETKDIVVVQSFDLPRAFVDADKNVATGSGGESDGPDRGPDSPFAILADR